eukprot:352610-Chlamydomonas_euryale.AAC.2
MPGKMPGKMQSWVHGSRVPGASPSSHPAPRAPLDVQVHTPACAHARVRTSSCRMTSAIRSSVDGKYGSSLNSSSASAAASTSAAPPPHAAAARASALVTCGGKSGRLSGTTRPSRSASTCVTTRVSTRRSVIRSTRAASRANRTAAACFHRRSCMKSSAIQRPSRSR